MIAGPGGRRAEVRRSCPPMLHLCVCCSQLLGAVTRYLPVYLARCTPKLSAEHKMRNTLSPVRCCFSLVAALLTILQSSLHCACQANPPSLNVPYSQYLNVSNVPAAVRNASGYYGLGRNRRCFCRHGRVFVELHLDLPKVLHRGWDRSKPVDVVECHR